MYKYPTYIDISWLPPAKAESFAVICYQDNLYSTRLNLRGNYAVSGIQVGWGLPRTFLFSISDLISGIISSLIRKPILNDTDSLLRGYITQSMVLMYQTPSRGPHLIIWNSIGCNSNKDSSSLIYLKLFLTPLQFGENQIFPTLLSEKKVSQINMMISV